MGQVLGVCNVSICVWGVHVVSFTVLYGSRRGHRSAGVAMVREKNINKIICLKREAI